MRHVACSVVRIVCGVTLVFWLMSVGACRTVALSGRDAEAIAQKKMDEIRKLDTRSFLGMGIGTAENDSVAANDARLWAVGDLAKSIRTSIRETIGIFRESTLSAKMQKDVQVIEQDLLEATKMSFPPRLTYRLITSWKDDGGYCHAAMVVTIQKLEYMKYYFSLLPLESPSEILSRVQNLFKQ